MQPNHEMDALGRHWPAEAPRADLADRILAHALAQPQRRPLAVQWRSFVTNLSTPSPALGFAFAACLVVAVIAFDPSPTSTTTAKAPAKNMETLVEQFIWDDYRY